jgi:hypothetical protein
METVLWYVYVQFECKFTIPNIWLSKILAKVLLAHEASVHNKSGIEFAWVCQNFCKNPDKD